MYTHDNIIVGVCTSNQLNLSPQSMYIIEYFAKLKSIDRFQQKKMHIHIGYFCSISLAFSVHTLHRIVFRTYRYILCMVTCSNSFPYCTCTLHTVYSCTDRHYSCYVWKLNCIHFLWQIFLFLHCLFAYCWASAVFCVMSFKINVVWLNIHSFFRELAYLTWGWIWNVICRLFITSKCWTIAWVTYDITTFVNCFHHLTTSQQFLQFSSLTIWLS